MRRLVFVDLDDTLFQSLRKNPDADRLAAVDKDGAPLSFRCSRQEAFFEWLDADAIVIPVTGRSVEAYQRVLLPFTGHAICSFGGVILDASGAPEPQWHRHMSSEAEATSGLMADLVALAGEKANAHSLDMRYRVITDAGLPLYISIKHNGAHAGETAELASLIAPQVPTGWTVHINAHNMALLPPFLGKANAVSFFLKHIAPPSTVTIGVGDSLTDVGFMGLCDFAVAPSKSQIMSVLSAHSPLSFLCGGNTP